MTEKKVLRPEFTLRKVKLMKNDAGVLINYSVATKVGAATHEDSFDPRKCTTVPHPDLIDAIKNFDRFLMKSLGYSDIDVVRNSNDLSNEKQAHFKGVKKEIEALLKNTLDRISVSGISISGEEKNEGIIIMGKYATLNAIDVAINSPRIILSRDAFGFEAEAKEMTDRVIEEVFCYLFENKKSQLEIFDAPVKEKKKKKGETVDENQATMQVVE